MTSSQATTAAGAAPAARVAPDARATVASPATIHPLGPRPASSSARWAPAIRPAFPHPQRQFLARQSHRLLISRIQVTNGFL